MNGIADLRGEVQGLTWALLDEQAGDNEVRRLNDLLLTSSDARTAYIECVQMDADLYFLLGGKRTWLPPDFASAALPPLPTDMGTYADSPASPLASNGG